MSSSDESSESSIDRREEPPSSHSGLSGDEEEEKSPQLSQKKSPSLPPKPKEPELSSSSSSSSEDEDDDEPAAPKESKSKSKQISLSSSSDSDDFEEVKKAPPPTSTSKALGSISPDSSIAPEEEGQDDSNIVASSPKTPLKTSMPDLSEDSEVEDDDEQPKRKKVEESPKAGFGDEDVNMDSDDDIVGPRLHFDPEDVEQEEEKQPPIEYDVPLIHGDYGKEGPILTRWPNFLSVDHRPFTEDTYDPEEDLNAVDSEGRSRLQLKVENCIRWRNKLDEDGNLMKDEEGNEIPESNAKIVRWSDGTMTLNVGAEMYDITEHKIEEYNQLFLRMRQGLHGNAVFKKRFAFRPLTTDSLTHRKMTMQMAEKTNKSQKVKMIADVGHNPESSQASLIRKEEERMRATMRREAQQRKAKERQYRTGLSHGFLEDRDDFDDDPESLSAIKRSYKNNRFDRFDAITRRYAHEDDDDEEDNDSRRIERSKIESDDEEDSAAAAKKREEKKKRKIVISDEDED
jgi:RNA polymerase-associated protein LEO1